jgi:hypothetical protein
MRHYRAGASVRPRWPVARVRGKAVNRRQTLTLLKITRNDCVEEAFARNSLGQEPCSTAGVISLTIGR